MNNFTALSYDQVIQKIKQHKPDIDPSIYLYESIERRHIVPIFFLKHRVTFEVTFQKYHHARFCGWATAYDDELHHFFQLGFEHSNSDRISFKRVALLQEIKSLEWESKPDSCEQWEIELKSTYWPWYSEDLQSGFSTYRSEVYFWLTDDLELSQTNATRTASTNNNDDTASLATVGALLALLKKHHQYKTQEKWIEEILKMKDAEFPHARALSESQMKKTFADANKALKDLKEQ